MSAISLCHGSHGKEAWLHRARGSNNTCQRPQFWLVGSPELWGASGTAKSKRPVVGWSAVPKACGAGAQQTWILKSYWHLSDQPGQSKQRLTFNFAAVSANSLSPFFIFYILILNTCLLLPSCPILALMCFLLFAIEINGIVLALVSMLWQDAFVHSLLKETFANWQSSYKAAKLL